MNVQASVQKRLCLVSDGIAAKGQEKEGGYHVVSTRASLSAHRWGVLALPVL